MGAITAAALGVSALAPVVGGIISNQSTGAARDAAQAASQKALQQIQEVGAGPDLAREILLREYKQAGIYSPELEQAVTQGVSQVSKLQERDPSVRQAQMDALSQFSELGRTGFGQADRAALNQARRDVETANRGRLESIRQNMAQRGMGGSGAELAQALQQSQSATNDLSASADRIAQQAQQARLAALAQQANIGSQVRGQDYQVDLAKAQAADELARFNALQQAGAQQRNVASKNQGQLFNLQNAQDIANKNVAQANAELLRQRAAEQTMYQNRQNQAGAASNALTGNANTQLQGAQQSAQNLQNIFGGIGQIGSTLATVLNKPKTARFNTETGQALYDPQTGKQYQ